MNLPLNIFSTTVTVLTGLVIYAYYASCDPRTIGEISKDDEVPTCIKAVLLEESQGAQRLLSKKSGVPTQGGGGVLPIMAYTGRLCPKGVPFSAFRFIKG